MGTRGRGRAALAAVGIAIAAASLTGGPAQAGLLGATAVANPVPLTDLFASVLPPLTGGTQRICAKSGLGIPVHCVENVQTLPSASPTASGVTFGHWVFCKRGCTGSLLVHELVHVRQFETHGDLFGPRYLAEAAVNGTGCENKWERPAYEATGDC